MGRLCAAGSGMRHLRRAARNPLVDLFVLFPDLPWPRLSVRRSVFADDTFRSVPAVSQATRAAVVMHHRITTHRRRAALMRNVPGRK